MTPDEYKLLAIRTESPTLPMTVHTTRDNRLLHAAMGMCTEAGEIQDALKRKLFYGTDYDYTNIVEEIGDTLWYIAVACDALSVSLEEVMMKNIAKLRARYPERFDSHKAVNRDLSKEREALEQ